MYSILKNIKLNHSILEKIDSQFKTDLKLLNESLIKNDFKNCFYKNLDLINLGLKQTFYNILDSLKTDYDLINLFNFNLNNKIKSDPNNKYNIIGFNIKPYILCDNMINNTCQISNKCYASKNEYAKKNNTYHSLLKNLKNYIFYYYCIYSNKTNHYLNIALFKNKSILSQFNIIRFNIKSDLIDNINLKFYNDMFLILKRHYNFKYAYTYTKSKNLDFNIIDKNFIINRSLIIKNLDDVKKFKSSNYKQCFITVMNKDIDIKSDLNIDVCNNYLNNTNCNKCIKCITSKNKGTYIH